MTGHVKNQIETFLPLTGDCQSRPIPSIRRPRLNSLPASLLISQQTSMTFAVVSFGPWSSDIWILADIVSIGMEPTIGEIRCRVASIYCESMVLALLSSHACR